MSVRNGVTVRGSSNGNERGSSKARAARKAWLLETYGANQCLVYAEFSNGAHAYVIGTGGFLTADLDQAEIDARVLLDLPWERFSITDLRPVPTARCYRCGRLLHEATVTVDRIIPGCKGGTYRRTNIRPACGGCNSVTGGSLRSDSGPSVR